MNAFSFLVFIVCHNEETGNTADGMHIRCPVTRTCMRLAPGVPVCEQLVRAGGCIV